MSTSEATVGDTELTLKPVTNDKVVEGDLGKFAERLELNKFTENKNEWKKFYDFAGLDFVWPSTNINERRLIFDYVVDPDWDPIGEELAANAIGYCNLLKSNTLDSSQGTHILLVHGKFVRYGSSEEEEELVKEFPGCYFVPVEKRIVELRKFPAIDNNTNKEWQVRIVYSIIYKDIDRYYLISYTCQCRHYLDSFAK